ncbi:hypothetical protein PR048_017187 [Dryococelus australis]|uniref:Uncharacterized protein n=1 Tax=Dryococelus australis TaxID=614101 RepID=A0ABQ9H8V9_9NEOP|nr:hypothetical protein PR048_017187 [Dryococelus australis]
MNGSVGKVTECEQSVILTSSFPCPSVCCPARPWLSANVVSDSWVYVVLDESGVPLSNGDFFLWVPPELYSLPWITGWYPSVILVGVLKIAGTTMGGAGATNKNCFNAEKYSTSGKKAKYKSGKGKLDQMLDEFPMQNGSGSSVDRLASAAATKKLENLVGCDWLHEVSVTIRRTKQTSIPNDRMQRCAMLESNAFVERLLKLACLEGPERTPVIQGLALDILVWVASVRLARLRTPSGDPKPGQAEFVRIIERKLVPLIKHCLLLSGRSIAHKCVKLIVICSEVLCPHGQLVWTNLCKLVECWRPSQASGLECWRPSQAVGWRERCVHKQQAGVRAELQTEERRESLCRRGIAREPMRPTSPAGMKSALDAGTVTFDGCVLQALLEWLPSVASVRSAGTLRWFLLLLCRVMSLDVSATTGQTCASLLAQVAEELRARSNRYHLLLRTRFGLYGTPFEAEMFDIDPPVSAKFSSTPITYASVVNQDISGTSTATTSTSAAGPGFGMPELIDLRELLGVSVAGFAGRIGQRSLPGSDQDLSPFLQSANGSNTPASCKGSATPAACEGSSTQHQLTARAVPSLQSWCGRALCKLKGWNAGGLHKLLAGESAAFPNSRLEFEPCYKLRRGERVFAD